METPDQRQAREEEDEHQRLHRQLSELLQELRVAFPGVQVLFAFLLTVPFSQRFEDVSAFQRHVYFATLLCSAAASAFLIAPTALHRIQFRQHDMERIIQTGHRQALAGLGALALAIVGVVLLITDFIFARTTTIVATAAVAVLFLSLWYVLPVARRVRDIKEVPPAQRGG